MSANNHHTARSGASRRKMQTSFLIGLLITFVVVYNRHLIAREIYPDYAANTDVPKGPAAHPVNASQIRLAMDTLRSGDLILISGKDTKSELFRNVNQKDKTYAYAGLVLVENNYPFVYHIALPSGSHPGGLVRDSFEHYVGARRVTGFGIYRYPVSNTQVANMRGIIREYYQKGVAYDNLYRLDTEREMYPAELVYKVMTRATKNKKFIAYTQAGPYTFVSVDNLFLRPKTQKIFSVIYY